MTTDKIRCNVCKHWYLFYSDTDNKLAHYVWCCEILAEIEKCVSAKLAGVLVALKLKWVDIERSIYI